MKKSFLVVIIFFSFIASNAYGAVSSSSGFLSDQIWYSKDSFIEGDSVDIHTAIWNGDNNSLSAKIEFYDKNVILGVRDIVIPPKKLKGVFIPWKITSGDHIISAKIISSSINTSSNKKEKISISNRTTKSDRKFVPTTIVKKDGEVTTSTGLIKDQINKIGDKVSEIIPESISKPVLVSFDSVDTFRITTLSKIIVSKEKTEEKIRVLDSFSVVDNRIEKKNNTKKEKALNIKTLEESTERPIVNIKLFLLKIIEYIFSHKIIFNSLIILILLYFLRSIYRKIRYR